MSTYIHATAAAVFPLALAYAGLHDLFSFRIPNWISLVIVVAFLAASLSLGGNVKFQLLHLSAGVAVLAVGWALTLRGLVGGGDAKLLAAAGVWFGWSGLPTFLLGVALVGGVVALVLLVFRRLPLPPAFAAWSWVQRLHAKDQGVPYGIAISLAAILLFPDLTVVAGPR